MPCWYYEKKELRNTPSLKDGITTEVEARYRREGARFIIDSGTKLGLRYDTCATGVVYFHRFYMFHSFRQFHRYVTAACCLFLAGKVEETPKKCKDIIKITRSMLTESQFAVFGDDPREEIMTLERILLQTIKFDLMVEHAYAYVLRFAKKLKGDKEKIEKLVQMSWTFVNDSLCTNLCLQWEPDIIAVSLMYLGSRLKKVELTDWEGKLVGSKAKWYDSLVPDVTLEIMEEVCHQVLDLYSKTKQSSKEDSPPPPPPPPKSTVSVTATKRSRSPSPAKGKKSRPASPAKAPGPSPAKADKVHSHSNATTNKPVPTATTYSNTNNPYMSSKMYSSSFMSGEGSNAIQTLIGGQSRAAPPANSNQARAPTGANSYPPAQYAQNSANPAHQSGDPPNYSNSGYGSQQSSTTYSTSSNPAYSSQQYQPPSGSTSYDQQQQQQQYPNQYNQQQYGQYQQQYSNQYSSSVPANQYSSSNQYPSSNQQNNQFSNQPSTGQGYNYNERGGPFSQTSGSGGGGSGSYSQQPSNYQHQQSGGGGGGGGGSGSYSQPPGGAGGGSYSQGQGQSQGSYSQQGYNQYHGGHGPSRGPHQGQSGPNRRHHRR